MPHVSKSVLQSPLSSCSVLLRDILANEEVEQGIPVGSHSQLQFLLWETSEPSFKSKNIREAGRMMNWVCLCVSRHPPEPGNVNDWINVYSPSHMLGRVLFLACYRNPLADSETKVTIKQSYWSIFHAKCLKTPMPTDLCVPGEGPSSNHK